MRLIDKWECNGIREAIEAGRDIYIDLPYIETVTASGWASCRQCGQKIAKGERAIAFPYSFTDGGSYNAWTAVRCYIHKSSCIGG